VCATQIKNWEKLKLQHAEQAKERFLRRVAGQIEKRGTLDALRKGVDELGCHFELAYFQKETTLNEEHARLHQANMGRRLEDQEGLRRELDSGVNPPEETRRLAFDTLFGETLEDMIDSDFDILKTTKDDLDFGALFRAVMYRRIARSLQTR